MCKRVEDGYELKSGKFIPYYNADLSTLTPNEFKDLSESSASLLDIIAIRQTQHDLGNKLQNIASTIDELKLIFGDHSNCPLNKKALKNEIELNLKQVFVSENFKNEVTKINKSWMKNTIMSTGNLAKAFIAIFTMFSGFGFIIYLIFNALGMKAN